MVPDGDPFGIRIRGCSCCDYRRAQDHTIGRAAMLSGPGRVKSSASHTICVSRSVCASSNIYSFHFTEEDSMTKLGRSKTIRFLVFVVLVLATTSCANKRSSVPEQNAKSYGSVPER